MASDLAYDAFMALPDDARRANYEALVRDARSTQHKPMRRVNAQKRERLRTMKVLILDNSQREPSVASVWGHTLEDHTVGVGAGRGAFVASLHPLRHALRHTAWLGGEAPVFADYIAAGALMWLRTITGTVPLDADDPVHGWFERILDLNGGFGRNAPTARDAAA